jgi:hypothetical protein
MNLPAAVILIASSSGIAAENAFTQYRQQYAQRNLFFHSIPL